LLAMLGVFPIAFMDLEEAPHRVREEDILCGSRLLCITLCALRPPICRDDPRDPRPPIPRRLFC
jgi:hypothetical protein